MFIVLVIILLLLFLGLSYWMTTGKKECLSNVHDKFEKHTGKKLKDVPVVFLDICQLKAEMGIGQKDDEEDGKEEGQALDFGKAAPAPLPKVPLPPRIPVPPPVGRAPN